MVPAQGPGAAVRSTVSGHRPGQRQRTGVAQDRPRRAVAGPNSARYRSSTTSVTRSSRLDRTPPRHRCRRPRRGGSTRLQNWWVVATVAASNPASASPSRSRRRRNSSGVLSISRASTWFWPTTAGSSKVLHPPWRSDAAPGPAVPAGKAEGDQQHPDRGRSHLGDVAGHQPGLGEGLAVPVRPTARSPRRWPAQRAQNVERAGLHCSSAPLAASATVSRQRPQPGVLTACSSPGRGGSRTASATVPRRPPDPDGQRALSGIRSNAT